MINVLKKIAALSKAIGSVQKNSTNPYFNSKYIEINDLLEVLGPELASKNVSILQPLTTVDGRPAINTVVIDHDSDEVYESAFVITDLPDPQKMGSAITYSRRYALISLLSLQQLDDDANITTTKPTKAKSAKSKATTKAKTAAAVGAW
jgi:hypothetical protein